MPGGGRVTRGGRGVFPGFGDAEGLQEPGLAVSAVLSERLAGPFAGDEHPGHPHRLLPRPHLLLTSRGHGVMPIGAIHAALAGRPWLPSPVAT